MQQAPIFHVPQPIDPLWVESISQTADGKTRVYFTASSPVKNSFETPTKIADVRGPFLKSTRFIHVAIAPVIKPAPGISPETQALINIDEIASLQMFKDGKAYITLKQGGDIDGVVLDEVALKNLIRRADLRRPRKNPDIFKDSIAYNAPKKSRKSVTTASMALDISPRVGVKFNDRVCPKCPRTSPCASVNCGLKPSI
jgi:hypothetical protein